MHKLIGAYMLIFLIFTFFSSVSEGGGGILGTVLDETVTVVDTDIKTTSTDGFLVAGSIVIGDEEIAYNGLTATNFQNCVRGYRKTNVEVHEPGDLVYSPASAVLNRSLGFDIVSTNEAYGGMAVIALTWTFLTKAIGYLVTFNFGILGGEMVYLRYLLMAPAVGLVVYFGFSAMGTLFGVLSNR